MKIFCMVVLCACLFIACEKDNDDYEPVKPPKSQMSPKSQMILLHHRQQMIL